MQNAGLQYGQGATPMSESPFDTVVQSGITSSTASLRQFRKKDVEKSTLGGGTTTGVADNSSHVARVAPHNHYPPRPNDFFRYPAQTQYQDYNTPFKDHQQVKYSEIAEVPQSIQHVDNVPTAIQKHKEKEYIEMCNIPQQSHLNKSYPEHMNRQQNYPSVAPDLSVHHHQYLHKEHQLHGTYKPPESQYTPKESQYNQFPQIPKYNVQQPRKYHPPPPTHAENDFLAQLQRIHPDMARSIMNESHYRDNYSMDQNRLYSQNQRYYPNPLQTNSPYSNNYPHRNIQQHYNYQNACSYPRTTPMNSAMPRYPPLNMERSLSPRRNYDNVGISMNYPPHPMSQKISPNYQNFTPEYAQHYQHRRPPPHPHSQIHQEYYQEPSRSHQYLGHHQLTQSAENHVTPSNNIRHYLENWAEEEGVNEAENPKYIYKEPLRREESNEVFVIASEIPQQYLENGLITSENGQYIIKGLDNNSIKIIDKTTDGVGLLGETQERVVSLHIVENPKSSYSVNNGMSEIQASNQPNTAHTNSTNILNHAPVGVGVNVITPNTASALNQNSYTNYAGSIGPSKNPSIQQTATVLPRNTCMVSNQTNSPQVHPIVETESQNYVQPNLSLVDLISKKHDATDIRLSSPQCGDGVEITEPINALKLSSDVPINEKIINAVPFIEKIADIEPARNLVPKLSSSSENANDLVSVDDKINAESTTSAPETIGSNSVIRKPTESSHFDDVNHEDVSSEITKILMENHKENSDNMLGENYELENEPFDLSARRSSTPIFPSENIHSVLKFANETNAISDKNNTELVCDDNDLTKNCDLLEKEETFPSQDIDPKNECNRNMPLIDDDIKTEGEVKKETLEEQDSFSFSKINFDDVGKDKEQSVSTDAILLIVPKEETDEPKQQNKDEELEEVAKYSLNDVKQELLDINHSTTLNSCISPDTTPKKHLEEIANKKIDYTRLLPKNKHFKKEKKRECARKKRIFSVDDIINNIGKGHRNIRRSSLQFTPTVEQNLDQKHEETLGLNESVSNGLENKEEKLCEKVNKKKEINIISNCVIVPGVYETQSPVAILDKNKGKQVKRYEHQLEEILLHNCSKVRKVEITEETAYCNNQNITSNHSTEGPTEEKEDNEKIVTGNHSMEATIDNRKDSYNNDFGFVIISDEEIREAVMFEELDKEHRRTLEISQPPTKDNKELGLVQESHIIAQSENLYNTESENVSIKCEQELNEMKKTFSSNLPESENVLNPKTVFKAEEENYLECDTNKMKTQNILSTSLPEGEGKDLNLTEIKPEIDVVIDVDKIEIVFRETKNLCENNDSEKYPEDLEIKNNETKLLAETQLENDQDAMELTPKEPLSLIQEEFKQEVNNETELLDETKLENNQDAIELKSKETLSLKQEECKLEVNNKTELLDETKLENDQDAIELKSKETLSLIQEECKLEVNNETELLDETKHENTQDAIELPPKEPLMQEEDRQVVDLKIEMKNMLEETEEHLDNKIDKRIINQLHEEPLSRVPEKPLHLVPEKSLDLVSEEIINSVQKEPLDMIPKERQILVPVEPLNLVPERPLGLVPEESVNLVPVEPLDIVPNKPPDLVPENLAKELDEANKMEKMLEVEEEKLEVEEEKPNEKYDESVINLIPEQHPDSDLENETMITKMLETVEEKIEDKHFESEIEAVFDCNLKKERSIESEIEKSIGNFKIENDSSNATIDIRYNETEHQSSEILDPVEEKSDSETLSNELQYRSAIKIEENSVLLHIAGEFVEINVTTINGKKVISVVPLSSSMTVDFNDNYEKIDSVIQELNQENPIVPFEEALEESEDIEKDRFISEPIPEDEILLSERQTDQQEINSPVLDDEDNVSKPDSLLDMLEAENVPSLNLENDTKDVNGEVEVIEDIILNENEVIIGDEALEEEITLNFQENLLNVSESSPNVLENLANESESSPDLLEILPNVSKNLLNVSENLSLVPTNFPNVSTKLLNTSENLPKIVTMRVSTKAAKKQYEEPDIAKQRFTLREFRKKKHTEAFVKLDRLKISDRFAVVSARETIKEQKNIRLKIKRSKRIIDKKKAILSRKGESKEALQDLIRKRKTRKQSQEIEKDEIKDLVNNLPVDKSLHKFNKIINHKLRKRENLDYKSKKGSTKLKANKVVCPEIVNNSKMPTLTSIPKPVIKTETKTKKVNEKTTENPMEKTDTFENKSQIKSGKEKVHNGVSSNRKVHKKVEGPKKVEHSKRVVHPKNVAHSKKVEHFKNVEDSIKVEHSKKIEHSKNVEHSKRVEHFKNIEDSKKVEHSKKIEHSKKVEHKKTVEHFKNVEYSKKVEHSKKVEQSKNDNNSKNMEHSIANLLSTDKVYRRKISEPDIKSCHVSKSEEVNEDVKKINDSVNTEEKKDNITETKNEVIEEKSIKENVIDRCQESKINSNEEIKEEPKITDVNKENTFVSLLTHNHSQTSTEDDALHPKKEANESSKVSELNTSSDQDKMASTTTELEKKTNTKEENTISAKKKLSIQEYNSRKRKSSTKSNHQKCPEKISKIELKTPVEIPVEPQACPKEPGTIYADLEIKKIDTSIIKDPRRRCLLNAAKENDCKTSTEKPCSPNLVINKSATMEIESNQTKSLERVLFEMEADAVVAKADTNEVKPDRSEVKRDRIEAKPDRSEAKPDHREAKSDRSEAKSGRSEAKPDRSETKQDIVEAEPVAVEGQLKAIGANSILVKEKPIVVEENVEEKVEVIKEKVVVFEEKPSVVEAKPLVVEPKPLIVEAKLFLVEANPVVVETKVAVEAKLDANETKPIAIEAKLDTEIKPDPVVIKPIAQKPGNNRPNGNYNRSAYNDDLKYDPMTNFKVAKIHHRRKTMDEKSVREPLKVSKRVAFDDNVVVHTNYSKHLATRKPETIERINYVSKRDRKTELHFNDSEPSLARKLANFNKTSDTRRSSQVTLNDNWEESNSPKGACLTDIFADRFLDNKIETRGLNLQCKPKFIIDVNEMEVPVLDGKDYNSSRCSVPASLSSEDDSLQIYREEVDSKLNSLNITIPKISKSIVPPNVVTSPPVNDLYVSRFEDDLLMKRFLRKEKLTPDEIRRVSKIVYFKKKIQEIGRSRNFSHEEEEKYEIRRHSMEKDREIKLHLKKVGERDKMRRKKKRFRNLHSASPETSESEVIESLGDYSVYEGSPQTAGVPKLIFKRKTELLQPVVRLERSDKIEIMAKKLKVL